MKTIFAFIESKKEKKIIKNIKSCLKHHQNREKL